MFKVLSKVRYMGFALLLAGCAAGLPRGVANEREILKSAEDPAAGFAVYEVTRALLPSVAHWPATGGVQYPNWGVSAGGGSGQIIVPGDSIDLTIWDSAESSLLSSPEQKVVSMSGVRVSPGGSVFVPYLDEIRISGMSPDRARSVIQNGLEAIIPSAQVQLSLTPGRQSTVDMVGGVATPGSYPLVDRNTTVLAMLAKGGGASTALRNPLVKLVRSGKTHAISLERLYASPELDTAVQGGDKIILEDDRRYFIALGAAGTQDIVPFSRASMSALEALAEMGGLSANRANPEGVLVLRDYPASAVVAAQDRGPREQRVVFTLNLATADGLFSAKQFQIMPGDVVLPTESPVTNVQTIFGLVGSVFGIANTATGL
jgi:polysaccharide export outer membrane protein